MLARDKHSNLLRKLKITAIISFVIQASGVSGKFRTLDLRIVSCVLYH
jgi:hypothetical protein